MQMKKLVNFTLPICLVAAYFVIGIVLSSFGMYACPIFMTCILDFIVVVLGFIYRKKLDLYFTKSKMEAFDKSLFIIIFAAVFLFGQFAGLWLYDNFPSLTYATYKADMASEIFSSVLLSLFLAPAAEEILIRGVVFQGWCRSTNPWIALILQALLFSVMHGTSVHLIPTFMFAIFEGVLYVHSKNLCYCVGTHILYNCLAFNIGGFSVFAYLEEPYMWAPVLIASFVALMWIYNNCLTNDVKKAMSA